MIASLLFCNLLGCLHRNALLKSEAVFMGKTQQFITIKEAAEYLGVTANTVRNWGAAGKIPEYRHPINNYRLFKQEEIEALRDRINNPPSAKRLARKAK